MGNDASLAARSQTGPAWVVAVGLAAVGILSWWLYLRPVVHEDAERLAALPGTLGAWRSRDIPIDQAVESILDADFNLQRLYLHPLGDLVWVYVGYYGTERGGTPEHLPRTCYRAQGWEVVSRGRFDIDPSRGLRANEFVVEREGHRRLVHFWYRSHRDTGILSTLALGFDHMLGQLVGRRSDGALVRISTPLAADSDVVAARSRLAGFGAMLEGHLGTHWPRASNGVRRTSNGVRR